jgi:hypothetical protein
MLALRSQTKRRNPLAANLLRDARVGAGRTLLRSVPQLDPVVSRHRRLGLEGSLENPLPTQRSMLATTHPHLCQLARCLRAVQRPGRAFRIVVQWERSGSRMWSAQVSAYLVAVA